MEIPKKLFHGSNVKFEQFKDGDNVYASDDINYAIFMAIINLRDNGRASAGVDDKGNLQFYIDEDFVNGESFFSTGYVYEVVSNNFSKTKEREYLSEIGIEIVNVREVTIKDLKEYINIRANW